MKLPILFLLSLITLSSSAQQVDRDKLFYAEKATKFRNMKTAGTVMATIGAGLIVYGISQANKATPTYNSYGQPTIDDNITYAIVGGVYLIGGGVTLAIIGSKKVRKYERLLQEVSMDIQPQLSPYTQGVAFTFRFR